MNVVLDFNSRPSLRIGYAGSPMTLSSARPCMRALIILAQNGTVVTTTRSTHIIQTYEVSEFIANLLAYMLDLRLSNKGYDELETALGSDDKRNIEKMVDAYAKAKKELEQLTLHGTTASGAPDQVMTVPFNSGMLSIKPIKVPMAIQTVYLLSVKTRAINVQYLTNIWSPYELLKLKQNPVGKVASDLADKYQFIEGYVKINDQDFKTDMVSNTDDTTIVIRRNRPILIKKRIQRITSQYKNTVITAIKKDIPVESIQALL